MTRVLGLLCALALLALPAGQTTLDALPVGGPPTEVVVTLAAPPLAGTKGDVATRARAEVDRQQAQFAAALHATVPAAQIRWRYRIVLNGAAVVVPRDAV